MYLGAVFRMAASRPQSGCGGSREFVGFRVEGARVQGLEFGV